MQLQTCLVNDAGRFLIWSRVAIRRRFGRAKVQPDQAVKSDGFTRMTPSLTKRSGSQSVCCRARSGSCYSYEQRWTVVAVEDGGRSSWCFQALHEAVQNVRDR